MSKKIAAGAQAILLDVKAGNGAFMETVEDARSLATLMVSIGELSGRNVAAILSDMNQPLGEAVGNALEMKEAIAALRGEGPQDFVEHCLEIASHMLLLGKKADSQVEARYQLEESISSGSGLDYLKKLVQAQGGDVTYIDNPEKFSKAPIKSILTAQQRGTVAEVHARTVGETAVVLGAGRKKKGESIDPAVGILVKVKVGDAVEKGQPVFEVHARNEHTLAEANHRLADAVKIVPEEIDPLPLFYGVINSVS
jgi:pyrimidine-nucleoside phosphorylase